MAWIIVDIGERAWAQLAYQFGHELDHVLANSWQPHAKPTSPCQWLEEAIEWRHSRCVVWAAWRKAGNRIRPSPAPTPFGDAIADYRANIIER